MLVYYKVIAENRKAYHDYTILEKFNAGLCLAGTEVKSVRQGRANLKDGFGKVEKQEIWLYNVHITPYEKGSVWVQAATRPRKLLLNRGEIKKIIGKVAEKGFTLVPLKLFLSGNWVKVEMGLAKAKKNYEKRETIRRKTSEREIERALKEKGK